MAAPLMQVTFANGTTRQHDLFNAAVTASIYDFDQVPTEVTVSWEADPDPGDANEFAITINAGSTSTIAIIDDLDGLGRPGPYTGEAFYKEVVLHELGHVALAERIAQNGVADLYALFEHTITGAVGTAESWDSGAWEERILEGCAESFKDAFSTIENRLFSNRTNWRVPLGNWAYFVESFFVAATDWTRPFTVPAPAPDPTPLTLPPNPTLEREWVSDWQLALTYQLTNEDFGYDGTDTQYLYVYESHVDERSAPTVGHIEAASIGTKTQTTGGYLATTGSYGTSSTGEKWRLTALGGDSADEFLSYYSGGSILFAFETPYMRADVPDADHLIPPASSHGWQVPVNGSDGAGPPPRTLTITEMWLGGWLIGSFSVPYPEWPDYPLVVLPEMRLGGAPAGVIRRIRP